MSQLGQHSVKANQPYNMTAFNIDDSLASIVLGIK